jgi:hypothetical protein
VLEPNVRHSVKAADAARMLLTVHLHGHKHDDAPRRVEPDNNSNSVQV